MISWDNILYTVGSLTCELGKHRMLTQIFHNLITYWKMVLAL